MHSSYFLIYLILSRLAPLIGCQNRYSVDLTLFTQALDKRQPLELT